MCSFICISYKNICPAAVTTSITVLVLTLIYFPGGTCSELPTKQAADVNSASLYVCRLDDRDSRSPQKLLSWLFSNNPCPIDCWLPGSDVFNVWKEGYLKNKQACCSRGQRSAVPAVQHDSVIPIVFVGCWNNTSLKLLTVWKRIRYDFFTDVTCGILRFYFGVLCNNEYSKPFLITKKLIYSPDNAILLPKLDLET